MKRLGLALRTFFRIVTDAALTPKIEALLAGTPGEVIKEEMRAPAPSPPPPVRNDAVTLLAMLQREARLVDFLQESLDSYSNEQIGAAVRDVHRDSRAVLDKAFALQPVSDQAEGQPVTIPAGFDPAQYRLTGNVTGEAPHQGKLCHHGWRVSRCDLPQWQGAAETANVVMPAEVEL